MSAHMSSSLSEMQSSSVPPVATPDQKMHREDQNNTGSCMSAPRARARLFLRWAKDSRPRRSDRTKRHVNHKRAYNHCRNITSVRHRSSCRLAVPGSVLGSRIPPGNHVPAPEYCTLAAHAYDVQASEFGDTRQSVIFAAWQWK